MTASDSQIIMDSMVNGTHVYSLLASYAAESLSYMDHAHCAPSRAELRDLMLHRSDGVLGFKDLEGMKIAAGSNAGHSSN